MIRYLLDSSALWRILRDAALRAAWAEVISLGVIGSCHPQRVEFRRLARTLDEYEQSIVRYISEHPHYEAPYRNAARMMSPEQLGQLYLEVHHRMRRVFDDGMSVCGLSMARTKVLAQLQLSGAARPSVLAAQFGVAPRTITELVDTLERDGLVVRHADPTDRRALLVALTSEGEAALAVADAARARLMKQVFGALEADERATMARLLQTLDDAMAPLSTSDPHAEEMSFHDSTAH